MNEKYTKNNEKDVLTQGTNSIHKGGHKCYSQKVGN